MDENTKKKLEEYYEKQEAILNQVRNRKKELDLISRGLYYKEFSREFKPGYTYSIKDRGYIRKIPYEVSYEEYEKIKNFKTKKQYHHVNSLSILLVITGIIIMIIAIPLGIYNFNDHYIRSILIWFGAYIISLFSFSLAEIIRLLEKNKEEN